MMNTAGLFFPLAALLSAAALEDMRHHRIPNLLVFPGAALGVALKGFQASGFFAGSLEGIEGWGLALALLFPLYWLRVMGAGDVKLVAMVGAYLGPADLPWALLATFLAGGAMAIAIVLRDRTFMRLMQNLKSLVLGSVMEVSAGSLPVMGELPGSVGNIPYAVPIGIGTMGYLIWQHLT